MVRTQVQLTEKQMAQLRKMSLEQGVPLAELIRRAVDELIARRQRRKQRLLQAIGRFSSGIGDLAERHDFYLGEEPDAD